MSNGTSLLPTVLVVGMQKGGTSSIFAHLADQKGHVCTPSKPDPGEPDYYAKELHFFDDRFSRGRSFYESKFRHCPRDGLDTLDATPNYIFYAERIREFYGDEPVKLIISLREPVSREVSWYRHQTRPDAVPYSTAYFPNGTLMSFPAYTKTRDFSKGYYHDRLRDWFDHFDRSQILILSYDELSSDPRRYFQRIHDFLGLPKLPENFQVPRSNGNEDKFQRACSVEEELAQHFAFKNQQLYTLLDEQPGPWMEQRPFPEFQFRACHS